MFTDEELLFLHQLLDEVNVRGLSRKRMVLDLMSKIEEHLAEYSPDGREPVETTPERDSS